MKIKTKMILSAVLIPAAIFLSEFVNQYFSMTSENEYREIITQQQKIAYDLRSMQYLMVGIANDERGFLLNRDDTYVDNIHKKQDELNKLAQEILPLLDPDDTDDKEQVEKFIEEMSNYNSFTGTLLNRAGYNSVNGDYPPFSELTDVYAQEREVRKSFNTAIEAFVLEKDQDILNSINEVRSEREITNYIVMGITGAAIVYSIIQSLILIRSLRPLNRMSSQLSSIADGGGDLVSRLEVKTKDEVGEAAGAYNRLIEGIRAIIVQTQTASAHVAGTSSQLNSSAEEIRQASQHTTEVMEELASGMEGQLNDVQRMNVIIQELVKGLDQISELSQHVSSRSGDASQGAAEGMESITQALHQMEIISEKVGMSAQAVLDLSGYTDKIGHMGQVITQLAKQTGMLALNASIEAARAGEHGRGFAVVATEVRNLAEQSSASAHEIAEFVREIQNSIETVSVTMQDGTNEVENGIIVMQQAESSFRSIEHSVGQVNDQIHGVTAAVKEMTAGSGEIMEAANRILAVTDQAAGATQSVSATAEQQLASMEEVTASTESLSEMSGNLSSLVGGFKV
ncbi:methyl-accepting chemotaxis protein [Paenibacillus sp. JX-17]|uniref:Methyl-accepting chemotaxis protein n=1 Tax=Paenibacillus lacisoli TaxID=3064525 RepID=A0ABT9C9J4_9BACL|nr:methyl-accepting chemotaxis protein [Paenibacillus sp. JX-17]MDO7905931.1 methyl-accepting chemotaxis protein [Paenibacillus sp. JX-17]